MIRKEQGLSAAADEANSVPEIQTNVVAPNSIQNHHNEETEAAKSTNNQQQESTAQSSALAVASAAASPTTITTSAKPARTTPLYKNSSRFKGYFTLTLASAIHYNASRKCQQTIGGNAVACSTRQRRYALAVSLVSLILSTLTTWAHLDPTILRDKVWSRIFRKGSKVELGLIIFLILWWSVAVGMETTVLGIAGDGKEQYSLFYSSWTCCLVSYLWILEKYLMDAFGWSSFQGFISSWPYRAPAWICIGIFSLFTLVWYLDLWKVR
jgi:hypothetical protein